MFSQKVTPYELDYSTEYINPRIVSLDAMKRHISLALSDDLIQIIDARRSTSQGEVPRSAFVEKELKRALLSTNSDGNPRHSEPQGQ